MVGFVRAQTIITYMIFALVTIQTITQLALSYLVGFLSGEKRRRTTTGAERKIIITRVSKRVRGVERA